MIDPIQKEQLRHTVLEVLATRHPAALTIAQIYTRAAMVVDFPVSTGDIESALAFLKGLENAAQSADEFGSTEYWAATSKGVLAWERSHRPNKPRHD